MATNVRSIPETQGKITTTFPDDSVCTASNNGVVLTATSSPYIFNVPSTGTWNISCTNGVETASDSCQVPSWGTLSSVSLSFKKLPTFTYSGDWKWLNDDENTGVLELYSSGTITFSEQFKAEVCIVGGGGGAAYSGTYTGGGGAGSGYMTNNTSGFFLSSATISIGAGGTSSDGVGKDGGTTTFASSNYTGSANGGQGGQHAYGGKGGSGGAGITSSRSGYYSPSIGGSDGSNGTSYDLYYKNDYSGKGSGITTRAFGDPTMPLCCGGGRGESNDSSSAPGFADNDYGRGGSAVQGMRYGHAGVVYIRKKS